MLLEERVHRESCIKNTMLEKNIRCSESNEQLFNYFIVCCYLKRKHTCNNDCNADANLLS